jgi:hypothetical protein
MKTIIESAFRHLGPSGFDVTPTLEISHEGDGTKPLIYYLISYLADLPKHTATVSQNINNIICRHFQTFNELPEKLHKIVCNFSGKFNALGGMYLNKTRSEFFIPPNFGFLAKFDPASVGKNHIETVII